MFRLAAIWWPALSGASRHWFHAWARMSGYRSFPATFLAFFVVFRSLEKTTSLLLVFHLLSIGRIWFVIDRDGDQSKKFEYVGYNFDDIYLFIFCILDEGSWNLRLQYFLRTSWNFHLPFIKYGSSCEELSGN